MRKVCLLFAVIFAAALLAGCVGGASSSKPADSDTPVSSGAPAPTLTPTVQATVTTGEGLTLVAAVEEAALLERLGNSGVALCSPVFVSADRLLLPVRLPGGGAEWYLYEPETDALTLIARLTEDCPEIPAAWEEGEQIRVISDIGAFTLDPAGGPDELPGSDSDWTLRGNPVTGEVYHRQGGQLIATAPDGSESVRYVWLGKGSPSAVAVSPDGGKLFFGIIPYEGISDVVVLDLATGAAEVTPMQAAYPWYCWLGEQPCLVTLDETQEGLLLQYGDDLANTFLWQPDYPDDWRSAQVAGCAAGQVLLTFSYPIGEEDRRDALSLLSWDGTGVTERGLLETDGLISGTAFSPDAGALAVRLRDGVDLPLRLLIYAIDN